MLSEIFKITAVIKDQKTLLVRIFAVNGVHAAQPLAESCASADHLPELRLGTNFLEKDKIHTVGHIHARIHHVHGNGDHGHFLMLEILLFK